VKPSPPDGSIPPAGTGEDDGPANVAGLVGVVAAVLHTESHNALVIRAARVIDPALQRDEIADVIVVDGRYAERASAAAHVLEGQGLIVCPGLMDIHVHLREPGFEHKETIESGTAAAAAGGFTFVACMPNTKPPLDNPKTVALVLEKARQADRCTVAPIAAITRGRRGVDLTHFAALREAGAVAFSDDGDGVQDTAVMRAAFQQATRTESTVIQHCQDNQLAGKGVLHGGLVAAKLKLRGIDPAAEETMLERDLALCRETRARYHVAHVSTARAVDLIRKAKAEGLPVTAEVCTHHLALTDEACAGADPNTKMNPPLRPRADVEACRRGLVDGTIDCIVTDHAPHSPAEKAVGFAAAPFGVIGLETALGVAAGALIQPGLTGWPTLIARFTVGPASVLHLPLPHIATGQPANLTLINPAAPWTVDPLLFESRSRNTPFAGWRLAGRPVCTLRGHRLTRPAW